MIQIIGMIEILIFYVAYFIKLIGQKRRGIKTNQLGHGTKSRRTIIIELQLKIMSMFIVVAMVASVVLDTARFTEQVIRSLGLILFAIGIYLFITAMVTMKDSWRAGIPSEEKTTMISSGIFRFSRNPAFLGFDLTYIGVCLAFGNLVLFIIATITIITLHLQILEEEKFLENTFKEEYLTYKRKVGRYFLIV